MWVVIGVMLKKVGIASSSVNINQIVSNAKKYSETVVVTGSHMTIDPDA
jgi:ribosomal protein L18E